MMIWEQIDPECGMLRIPPVGILPGLDLHVALVEGFSVAWWVDADGQPLWFAPSGDA